MLTHNYGNYRILFLKWEFKRKHIIICLDYTVMSDFDMVSLFPQMQMLKIRYLSSLYVCLSILWINKREAQDAYEILFKGKINFFWRSTWKKILIDAEGPGLYIPCIHLCPSIGMTTGSARIQLWQNP